MTQDQDTTKGDLASLLGELQIAIRRSVEQIINPSYGERGGMILISYVRDVRPKPGYIPGRGTARGSFGYPPVSDDDPRWGNCPQWQRGSAYGPKLTASIKEYEGSLTAMSEFIYSNSPAYLRRNTCMGRGRPAVARVACSVLDQVSQRPFASVADVEACDAILDTFARAVYYTNRNRVKS